MVQIDPEPPDASVRSTASEIAFSERAGRMSKRNTSLPSFKSGVSEGWSKYALGLAGR